MWPLWSIHSARTGSSQRDIGASNVIDMVLFSLDRDSGIDRGQLSALGRGSLGRQGVIRIDSTAVSEPLNDSPEKVHA